MREKYSLKNSTLELILGDITELHVEAIVNAANEHLILGAGVAGAIRLKGGASIQEECNHIGGTQVGGAVLTNAGNLPAKYVIHAVGPRFGEGDEDRKLARATRNSLVLSREFKIKSIAFPAISTGIFGFPVLRCAEIMLREAIGFLISETYPPKLFFCLWDNATFDVFKNEAERQLEAQAF